jgi:hypothetical protein
MYKSELMELVAVVAIARPSVAAPSTKKEDESLP